MDTQIFYTSFHMIAPSLEQRWCQFFFTDLTVAEDCQDFHVSSPQTSTFTSPICNLVAVTPGPSEKMILFVLSMVFHPASIEVATLDAAELSFAELRKRLPSSHWQSLQE